MHDIEPYFKWRDLYVASEDEQSPFYGQIYNEFEFTSKIYNYYIHPQWDNIGSSTLYIKVIYVDYASNYAFIELIGEWNDAIHNDIMYLKRDVIDPMVKSGIQKFILLCDNVLNFHASDDSYYEEWYDDIKDEEGWVCLINTFDHVNQEMKRIRLQYYINFGSQYNDLDWRRKTPENAYEEVRRKVER